MSLCVCVHVCPVHQTPPPPPLAESGLDDVVPLSTSVCSFVNMWISSPSFAFKDALRGRDISLRPHSVSVLFFPRCGVRGGADGDGGGGRRPGVDGRLLLTVLREI